MTAENGLSTNPEPHLEPGRSPALQISNAVGRVHKQLVGRGPTNVRTQIGEDMVVCLLEGGFTQAEQTVWAADGQSAVIELRIHLQEAMRRAIVEIVEAIIGRRVRSFMSASDPDERVQAEVMLLDPDRTARLHVALPPPAEG
jgi:uncharacterized protein YbcI